MACRLRTRTGIGTGIVAALLAALVVLPTTGCASKGEKITKPKDPLKLRSMVLRMESGANGNWPVRVDLVRTKDADLLPRLTAMKADGWFGEAGTSFRDAHPEVYVDSWEVVPGTVVGPFKVRLRERVAGVLFCNTRSSPPPLRLAIDGAVLVTVDDDRCRVGEGRNEPQQRRRWFGQRNEDRSEVAQ